MNEIFYHSISNLDHNWKQEKHITGRQKASSCISARKRKSFNGDTAPLLTSPAMHTLSMSSLNIYAPGILCRKRKWLPCGASLKSWRQGTEPAWEMSGGCGRTTPVQAAHQRLRGQQMWKGGREGRLQQPLSIFFHQLKTSSLLWLKRTANKPACTEGTSMVH